MNAGIYAITNLSNQKKYVGSAVNLNRRKYEHFWSLKKNEHFNPHLQRAFLKYGESCFKFEILEVCESRAGLTDKESEWIRRLESNNPEKGYNSEGCLATWLGRKHSEETKQKIRDARALQEPFSEASIKKRVESTRNKNPNHFSEAAKKGWEILRSKGIFRPNINPEVYRTKEYRLKMSQVSKQNALKRATPFVCLETGKVYRTTSEAAEEFGVSYKSVWKVLKGQKPRLKGKHFQYVKTELDKARK